MENLLTAEKVANLLGLSSRRSVYTMAARGVIPSTKVGRLVRFRVADIEGMLSAGTRPSRLARQADTSAST